MFRLNVTRLCSAFFGKIQISSQRKMNLRFTNFCCSFLGSAVQPERPFTAELTTSDSFILMVILLTASVALVIIFRKPAPLRA